MTKKNKHDKIKLGETKMINFEERIKIRCPKCYKLVCTADINANTKGIYFWCARCKKEFEEKEERTLRSQ